MITDLETSVEVLIVGGGPVGLAASLELSRQGVSSLLVERHLTTSLFPKARLVSTRTMELARGWGVADAIERAGLPRGDSLAMFVGTSLAGPQFRREVARTTQDAPQSPSYTYICSQDRLEVVLRDAAQEQQRASLRFGVALSGFRIDTRGVRAVLQPSDGGPAAAPTASCRRQCCTAPRSWP